MAEYATTEESINRFLTTISAELDSHRRFMALHAPQLAPGFNAIDCLNPDENRLSAIIAMLLDPKGGHGQGPKFLDIFLELITPDDSSNATCRLRERLINLRNHCKQEANILQSKCKLEVTTDSLDDENKKRRIDILLDLNKFGLAIENKPWAMDQPRQIEDYHTHLSDKNTYDSNFLLIYLSSNGNPPNRDSVEPDKRLEREASGHFLIMSYTQLKKWCQRCSEKCQAPRLRYFLEDLADYIRDKFEGGLPEMDQKIVIDNATKAENRAAAVAVGMLWPQIAKSLMEDLASLAIKQAGLDDGPDKWEYYVDIQPSLQKGIQFRKTKWNQFSYHFSFEGLNATNFLYGVLSRNGKELILPNSVILALENDPDILKGDPPTNWYPWSQYFKEPFRNWEQSAWIGIKVNGDTVEQISLKLKKLDQYVTSAIDIIETQLADDI